jgi:hypothetical protein
VKIFRMGLFGLSRAKRMAEPPKVIPVPGAEAMDSMTYSMMNARLYVGDSARKGLFSLDPKKERVEEILGPDFFAAFGAGDPALLLSSVDGTRIHMVLFKPAALSVAMESTLAVLHLKSRKIEKIQSFPGRSFSGLDFYRSHYILADRVTGEVVTVAVRDKKVEILPNPPSWGGATIGFGMDLNRAVFLTPQTGEVKGKLVRYNIHVKE